MFGAMTYLLPVICYWQYPSPDIPFFFFLRQTTNVSILGGDIKRALFYRFNMHFFQFCEQTSASWRLVNQLLVLLDSAEQSFLINKRTYSPSTYRLIPSYLLLCSKQYRGPFSVDKGGRVKQFQSTAEQYKVWTYLARFRNNSSFQRMTFKVVGIHGPCHERRQDWQCCLHQGATYQCATFHKQQVHINKLSNPFFFMKQNIDTFWI